MTDITHRALPHGSAVCDSMCNKHTAIGDQRNLSFFGQVKEFFVKMFSTIDWPPRWHCGTWTDFHGWLYILSDLSIWAAYFAIPFLLYRMVKKRKDIPFHTVFFLFIAFILLCGTTHLLDAIIFWWPAYRLSAFVRMLTGIVSIFTVYALYKILPMVYNLRTLSDVEAEITERKKAEQEAETRLIMQRAAEELMARKDEFMSIASHELKTPITSVKASLQIIERMADKNENMLEAAPFIGKAIKQVNKLTEIIHDLMDVTRIQGGKLELVKTDFDLMEMVGEAVEQCAVDDRHEVNIEGDKVVMIHADRNRLEQVVCNLLTNAFKYSDESKPVTIAVAKLRDGSVKVEVIDRGIGIPTNKIEHIFDRFYRVDNSSKYFTGIGLGLYISSEIIKRHNGEIGVNSTEGEGSTFWFIV
ncbi:HAMP domain-containing sensor histidine kinase [Mucilaginibacter sp.]|jgi:signal transduction histidine kinase|uniref:sensor histidine kinase n=1 Tax=Mucilaginibacter sp. TaxID=1882438 RepID=UPI002C0601B2|nr:HAMP domain-containing sensor histidine kinase [Mucilaginibacter sp.]HTI61743.1 HAMP domain-containing sensor histidine kinase [Mucilaginibacter sp.]